MNSSAPATAVALLETDEQTAHRIADAVGESSAVDNVAVSLSDIGSGRWRVEIHFRTAPDEAAVRATVAAAAGRAAARALRFARVAGTDWVRASIAGLKPVAAGRFVVHGAHDRGGVPVNRIGIEIEAALAFGTGHHGTTRGCLLALDRICKLLSKRKPCHRHPEVRAKRASKDIGQGANRNAVALRGSSLRAEHLRATERHPRILDLGTGSGVLAIAAARAFRRRVVATDIDASAVRVARDNARLNRAGTLIEIARADGVAARSVRRHTPFDLVFANVLLGPLQRVASRLEQLMAPGGRIVLSGLLPAQANAALSAYRGCALERRITLDGWTTLVLTRQPRRASVAPRRPTS